MSSLKINFFNCPAALKTKPGRDGPWVGQNEPNFQLSAQILTAATWQGAVSLSKLCPTAPPSLLLLKIEISSIVPALLTQIDLYRLCKLGLFCKRSHLNLLL